MQDVRVSLQLLLVHRRMPAGGGSAGGGGGGGGGFGGGFGGGLGGGLGGFSGTGFSGSGHPSGPCGRIFWCICSLLWLIILILGFTISILAIISAFLSRPSTDIATSQYSPGDSRLLSLSSFFCDGGVLELTSNTVDAELYRVDSIPPLNNTNNFTVNEHSTFDPLEFRFWQYHLYPNSNITLSVHTDFRIDVFIVKGKANADRWSNSPSSDVAEESFERMTSIPSVLYQVQQEDEYFVIVHNSLGSRGVLVTASFTFQRFEYSPPVDADPDESCLVSEQGQCTVGIPYSTGSQKFLVVTSIPSNVDYTENIEVGLSCDQRGWAYALVILLPLSVVAAVIVAIIVGYVCYRRKHA